MASDSPARPTNIRYGVLVLATLIAVLLYLDRYCLSTADREIKAELGLAEHQMANVLGAFFFAYAFCQLPFGYLADRFGPRKMLTAYIVIWSGFTGLLGLARGYVELLLFRLGCGVFEAGAYPACAGVIRRWMPYPQRGLASGIVSLGGRLGGVITPLLTTSLMVALTALLPVGSWRPVMAIYGAIGVVLAIVFWAAFRDSPSEHPACNAAEADLVQRSDPQPTQHEAATPIGPLFLGVMSSGSLWLCSFFQFGVNFGWVFLFTYLNRYLLDVHQVEVQTRGFMVSLVAFIGLPALIAGGWLTDRLTERLGLRWGRCVPLVSSRFIAAAAFAAVPFLSDPWTIVVLLGAVAFFSDLGVPALWAYNMDVGGRNVGFVLGWGNMWGNLGAAVSPPVLNLIVQHFLDAGATTKAAWDAVFFTCGAVFAIIGVAAFGIDATRRVTLGDALPADVERALAMDDLERTEPIAPPESTAGSTGIKVLEEEKTIPLPPDAIERH